MYNIINTTPFIGSFIHVVSNETKKKKVKAENCEIFISSFVSQPSFLGVIFKNGFCVCVCVINGMVQLYGYSHVLY